MDDLIRRLEAATGPDHRLDGEIFRATNTEGKWWKFDGVWCRQDPNDTVAYDLPPSFTASIDAALTLVPGGLDWKVVARTHTPYQHRWPYEALTDTGNLCVGVHFRTHSGFGMTAPLALCVAALKARQAEAETKKRAADPKTGDPP